MSIRTTERTTYEDIWSLPQYAEHSPGEQMAELFQELATIRGARVLDAGCGSGKGALALHALGYRVEMCDITREGLIAEARGLPFHERWLWDDLRNSHSYDYVYCCDVMEHLPTEYTMLSVMRLLQAAELGTFFSISLVPDQFGALIGKPLHQTVRSFVWWRDHLKDLGRMVDCRDFGDSGVYWVQR